MCFHTSTTDKVKKLETHIVSKDLFSPKVDSNVETIINEINYSELSITE